MNTAPLIVIIGVYMGFITSLGGLIVLSIFRKRIVEEIGTVYWFFVELCIFMLAISSLLLLKYVVGIEYISGIWIAYIIGALSWIMLLAAITLAMYVVRGPSQRRRP